VGIKEQRFMDKTTPPIVSIVTCAYNAANYIDETIDSVLAQTFPDFELIIVDDGSSDHTVKVVNSYSDERIVLLEQENAGPAAARNTAIKHATGKYLAILDSDDLWLPNYLETMLGILNNDPKIDLAYPNAEYFGTPAWNGKKFMDKYPSTLPVTLEKILAGECRIFISSIFKREIVDTVGVFDTSLKGSEDLDLWMRICQGGFRFSFTTEVLAKYRKRSDSLSSGSESFYRNVIAAITKLKSTTKLTQRELELADQFIKEREVEDFDQRFRRKFAERNFQAAASDLREIIARQPSTKLRLVSFAMNLFPEILFKVANLKTSLSKY
jgi:glycosyltransferase involved in cell wall biosynthesis